MKKVRNIPVMVFVLVLLMKNISYAQESINVVCTIGQITDAAQTIGGGRVNVIGLMGAGVDPHLYKASESDVRKLSNAEIIFYGGLNLEAKMADIFGKMARNKKVVAISEVIPKEHLLDSVQYQGHFDPHIWFDIELWIKAVNQIKTSLIEYDPEGKDLYTANTQQYIEKLKILDRYIQKRVEGLQKEQRVLVTAHDAFRYFGKKYNFEVVGLQGISTESKAGVKDVMELAEFIAQRKIKAIFVESSVPERNIKAVQAAVKAKGWNVSIGGELYSDALGDEGTVEGTYIGMVTSNIDTIVDALKSN